MLRLAGMKKDSGNARRRERSCDVHCNLSGFTHTGGYEFCTAVPNVVDDEIDSTLVAGSNRDVSHGVAFGGEDVAHSLFNVCHFANLFRISRMAF